MRISDWSSDGCSSDLAEQRLRRETGLQAVDQRGDRGRLVAGRRPLRLHLEQLGVALLEAAVLQCIARGFLHGQNLGPSRPGSSERARLLQGRFRGRSRALRARRLRSEEHTSELPSLMRTSYAV